MVFWLEWASFEPLVPLYSGYYVALSSQAATWKFLHRQTGRQHTDRQTFADSMAGMLLCNSIVQLNLPSYVFLDF